MSGYPPTVASPRRDCIEPDMFTSDGKMSSALSRGADTNRFLFRVNDHLMGNPVAVQEKGWTDL